MIYNESLRSTKKKKKTNKIAEFKNIVLIRVWCMAYFAQCSTRNIPFVENAKSSRIMLHVWLMALTAVTRIPSSAARTIQFYHYQSALPPPATPFPPYPSIILLILAARQLFDGAALRTRKDLFLSPTIPIQSNSFRSAFHLAGGLFFFSRFWFLATSAEG